MLKEALDSNTHEIQLLILHGNKWILISDTVLRSSSVSDDSRKKVITTGLITAVMLFMSSMGVSLQHIVEA